jgi:hypothetical protein
MAERTSPQQESSAPSTRDYIRRHVWLHLDEEFISRVAFAAVEAGIPIKVFAQQYEDAVVDLAELIAERDGGRLRKRIERRWEREQIADEREVSEVANG